MGHRAMHSAPQGRSLHPEVVLIPGSQPQASTESTALILKILCTKFSTFTRKTLGIQQIQEEGLCGSLGPQHSAVSDAHAEHGVSSHFHSRSSWGYSAGSCIYYSRPSVRVNWNRYMRGVQLPGSSHSSRMSGWRSRTRRW